MNVNDLTVDISQEIEIKAAPGTVYRNMIAGLSTIMGGDGKLMEFTMEEWPGGRWFRDLGNGQGHLWGFVQVIKPPTLLEIYGPLMMSYPATNHLQSRFTAQNAGMRLTFVHRGIGLISQQHRDGMPQGWGQWIDKIRQRAERKAR